MTTVLASRQDIRGRRPRLRLWSRLRQLTALTFCLALTVLACPLVMVVHVMTWGRSRRWHSEVVCRGLARLALWVCGIRLFIHDRPSMTKQVVYISNHTSSLDMFVIIALGLTNTRYFLSGFLRSIPMLAILGRSIGVFWTCSQQDTQRRRNLFRSACDELRRTGESVFLTPEGQRIGVFNRGAFHLAAELEAPIVPIYIQIPVDVDPGPWVTNRDLDVRPGEVHVWFKPVVETDDWAESDVDEQRRLMRARYARWTEQARGFLPDEYR